MSAIAFPAPDPKILDRRDQIIAGLAALVPPECLVVSEDERRAFETDALTAYLENPKGFVKGTKMSFAGLKKEEDRAAIIAYLGTLAP